MAKLEDEIKQGSKLEDLFSMSQEVVESAKGFAEAIVSATDANVMYLNCYQLLKLGGLEAEIPRLVVFGQQSMGKTTLLDYIMGGPIGYSSSDTGTKQPVVMIIRPSNDSSGIMCKFGGQLMDIHQVQEAMRHHMQRMGDDITSNELEVEVFVPNGVHAIFVDLPGIKDDSKAGSEITRSVVRHYVTSNPNDLYILVKKASDDPANWPWSIREFILSEKPQGLGLSSKQTLVVGTRAKEFISNEKSDVKTQKELMERVKKRMVPDSKGGFLPLYILELFSLSIEQKEKGDFVSNKKEMHRQVFAGERAVMDMLSMFDSMGDRETTTTLVNHFKSENFLKDLNAKFQSMMMNQLALLERRLIRKKLDLEKRLSIYQDKISRLSPQSVRECTKIFIRQVLENAIDLVTGNYAIMKLPNGGQDFLTKYGGNLEDNLFEGHKLALQLFPHPEMYDPNFYDKIQRRSNEIFNEKLRDLTKMKNDQNVRYEMSSNRIFMFGLYRAEKSSFESDDGRATTSSINKDNNKFYKNDGTNSNFDTDTYYEGESVNVAFFYNDPQDESANSRIQHKMVEKSRLVPIVPFATTNFGLYNPPFKAWLRVPRQDGWIALKLVIIDELPDELKSLHIDPIKPVNHGLGIPPSLESLDIVVHMENDDIDPAGDGKLFVSQQEAHLSTKASNGQKREKGKSTNSEESTISESNFMVVKLRDLFVDATNNAKYYFSTPLQMISGPQANSRLLNQFSVTHISRWLKFQINHLEPDKQFSSDVLFQMMRSVRHVVDKADWEPLIADLLQANVRGTILHTVRLASCAGAAALRRILRASTAEVYRRIRFSNIDSGLLNLTESVRFSEELEQYLEEFCCAKALACAKAMRDAIFEQTHSIQFEVAPDIFEGVRRFEETFCDLPPGQTPMADAIDQLRVNMHRRKQSMQDRGKPKAPHELIYEEMRMQFWSIKMLLVAPLTTKLYTYFIKEVVEKWTSSSLEDSAMPNEAELERFLEDRILTERKNGKLVMRSDSKMAQAYELNVKYDRFLNEYASLGRTLEFVSYALQGVSAFRAQVLDRGGVDFLTKLELQ
ncbi:hypothetical protein BMR1_03g01095 [Babesia microti strain RI]|uniref:Dynamin N-terminal domain-containing protein n=1 Tax=Babesia microti (strain RI) TaxID=1133968 RepID=A0A0K3AQA6_BABMR|nr:hypothetical protein BMR1_03g01095 [Babesia microti strain RI]CTQ40818.1 hypothetical protein BMR1_03g01095 [Babesia microti strain RI]|eukprot:XP_012648829.1 hypothetical protein BMR1_03g01095 [Babesia microti strain RI]